LFFFFFGNSVSSPCVFFFDNIIVVKAVIQEESLSQGTEGEVLSVYTVKLIFDGMKKTYDTVLKCVSQMVMPIPTVRQNVVKEDQNRIP